MEEINIKDLLNVILKKLWLIFLIGLLFAGFVFAYTKFIKKPMYEASSTLVLTKANDSNDTMINQNDINVNQKLVYTYSELVKSKRILDKVIDNKKLKTTSYQLSKYLKVTTVDNTEVLKISIIYPDKKLSSKIVNEVTYVFGEEIKKIYKIDNISIIDWAVTPKKPCNNTLYRDLILGFLFGGFIVVLIIFVLYYFDDSVKYSDDLSDINGLPLMGKVNKEKKITSNEVIVSSRPKDLISEEIKSIRTNLSFSEVDKDLKTILITSTLESEGKSFISANLATAFAQAGKNVLLVDCDMRKGRQNKIFGVSNGKGLSDLLVKKVSSYNEFIKPTDMKNLHILPCGTVPPNPSELLGSDKNKELINLLSKEYDLIIFDGTPCSGLPDSIIMSTLVDKTLLVVSNRKTPITILNNAKKDLENVKANIVGVVINKVNIKENKYYGKYYSKTGEK